MKPAPFDYIAPDSLEAALALTAQYGSEAKLLAGGQSLIPAMNFRLIQPAILLDMNRLGELDGVRRMPDGGLALGAMTRQRRVEREPLVAQLAPLLAEAIPHIAHPQIRNRGTIGGSLAHADPAAELPVVAVALDAHLRLQSREGERWVAAQEFFLGMFTVDLQPDEVLVEIAFPPPPANTGWSFLEVARRRGDYALVGVAAVVSLDDQDTCSSARLVYLNVGDGPMDAQAAADLLCGQAITPDAMAAAASMAAEHEIDPFGNIHASAAFQRHLVKVLTRRALATALARARVQPNGAHHDHAPGGNP